MSRISLKRFSEALLALQQCESPTDLRHSLLRATQTLLDADNHVVNWLGRGAFKDFSVRTVPLADEGSLDIFNAHLHEHPLLPVIQEPWREGDIHAARWSDYTTLTAFRKTALYNEYFRRTETQHQLATTIRVNPKIALALSFNRKRRDFDLEDVAALDLLAPHVGCAVSRMFERMELENLLALQALTAEEEAVILLSEEGALLFATALARQLMRDYFPVAGAADVPLELLKTIGRNPSAGEVVLRTRPNGRLTCRYGPLIPNPDAANGMPEFKATARFVRRVRLEERSQTTVSLSLRSLGLTPREAEVLLWMAEGKRNSEIAVILQMSPRTVDKHSEHIFSKLGVETRASAVAMAWEARRAT